MKKAIKKLIDEHKDTLPKALVEGLITTIVGYGGGVLLVDIIGWRYYIVGILLIPVTFITKYVFSKYWVYKNERKKS